MTLKERMAKASIKAKRIEKLEGELKNYKEAVTKNSNFKEYHNSRILKLTAAIAMEKL